MWKEVYLVGKFNLGRALTLFRFLDSLSMSARQELFTQICGPTELERLTAHGNKGHRYLFTPNLFAAPPWYSVSGIAQ